MSDSKTLAGKKATNEGENRVVPKSPKRKCGVTDEPNLDVVIGYNVYTEKQRQAQAQALAAIPPIILINSNSLNEFPGLETVPTCKKILFRRVVGNGFFYELVKPNINYERVFLVCETNEGKLENISGKNFNLLFVGKDGKPHVSIKPSTTLKQTVFVTYQDQEIGKISKRPGGNPGTCSTAITNEPYFMITDAQQQNLYTVIKSYKVIKKNGCCVPSGNRKISNGFNIRKAQKEPPNSQDEIIGSIIDSELKVIGEATIVQKILLLATFVCIRSKALEDAISGLRQRLSMSISNKE